MPIKRWNGSSQVVQEAKRWNGSAWVRQVVKRWNGSAWVDVDSVTPVYTWEKWSVTATPASYSDDTGGAVFLEQIASISTWRLGTSYSFNTSTGAYTVSGDESAIANGGGYEMSGSDMNYYTVIINGGDPTLYDVTEYKHTASVVSYDYSKGGTQYTDVTSENSNAYPANGTLDNTYWYISK